MRTPKCKLRIPGGGKGRILRKKRKMEDANFRRKKKRIAGCKLRIQSKKKIRIAICKFRIQMGKKVRTAKCKLRIQREKKVRIESYNSLRTQRGKKPEWRDVNSEFREKKRAELEDVNS